MSIADAGQLAKLKALRGANPRQIQSHALRGPGRAHDFPDVSEVARPRGPAAYVAAAAQSGGMNGPVEDRAAISAEARQLAAKDTTTLASGMTAPANPPLPMHTATRAYASALQPSGEQGLRVSPLTESSPPRRNVSWVA